MCPTIPGQISAGRQSEERAANSRYFYELTSAKFGWDIHKVKQVQAFHFSVTYSDGRGGERTPSQAVQQSTRSPQHRYS